jgi:hypothetical protein
VASDQRYIFVHIPKTAGLSIRRVFESAFGQNNVSQPFVVSRIDSRQRADLDRYKMISGHISALDVRHFPNRQLITFLRDPIDRCLSLYSYFRSQQSAPLIPLSNISNSNRSDEAISLARQLDPEAFFSHDHPHLVQNIHNRMAWQLGYHADYSYRSVLTDEEVYHRALENLKSYTFIGFYENLMQDASHLQQRLSAEDQFALPSLNRTSNRLHREEVSERTIVRLEEITQWDRRLYDVAQALRPVG